jgi:small subunit ribosomal protein S21
MRGDARTRTARTGRISDIACVHVADGDVDRAIRAFKKQTERAGILRELKLREHFRPPSARRRAKSLRARKRDAKAAARRARTFTPQSEANENRWAE